jgi:CRP-like cAMP-binding protein
MLAPSNKINAFVASTALFKQLAEDEIERLAEHTREVRAERGTILFHRGDPSSGFYIVVYGQVKLFFTSLRGDEKVLEVVGPGQSFGEAVMFMNRPYPVSAQTLADSLLLYVRRDAVIAELERDPRLASRMIAGLCRHIHGLVSDVESYSLRSGAERVIGYLLRDCDGDTNGAYEVQLSTTKGVLASRLNITQEHFSRILHDLSARGLITVNGRTIRVNDVARLRADSV